jgi:Thioester domain/PEP-CTERM motif
LRVNMHRALLPAFTVIWAVTAGTASAGQITTWQLYDGNAAPLVTIYYTEANGTGSLSSPAYADPQVSYGTTTPVYYCVDLWHDNYVGQTYTINQVPSLTFANSTFADVDNRIGWLLAQDQSTVDDRAAVQLAIWYTIDNKPNESLAGFSMISSDPTLTADYSTLISFAGYNPSTSYAADFWQATHDPCNTLYQDLVTVGSVPEPSTMVLSMISLLFLVGFHRCRRFCQTDGLR